ncbi:MAG: polysaccharide deacetylase family protein [Oscillospiraceae bacterium]|nr:polysaccharide deacetylase family protein [Oscillospiraceae bacterium]
MKSRLLLICAIIGCAVILTSCKPNVPAKHEEEGNNTSITTLPHNNNTSGTTASTEEEVNPGGITSENENNNSAAVGENTPTADYNNLAFSAGERSSPLQNSQLSIGWGLGSATDDNGRPVDAVNANEQYGELGAVFIGENNNRIYLTFDEGYENGYTDVILDTLKSKGVSATFFVTYDYCKTSPELVKRMIREGHVVGNHSYSHPSFPRCSAEQVRDEIGKLHDYVKETFGYEMNLIRFPMGEFSERCLGIAQEMGYRSVFWSYAYVDWDVNNQPNPAVALKKLTNNSHPGAIFLLHAVSATNAEVLPHLIDYWHSEGYKLGLL